MMSGTDSVLLEDWVHRTNATPYTAPEAVCEWMTGVVFGHPYHEDGAKVTTSALTSGHRSQLAKGCKVTTINTLYKLGHKKNL